MDRGFSPLDRGLSVVAVTVAVFTSPQRLHSRGGGAAAAAARMDPEVAMELRGRGHAAAPRGTPAHRPRRRQSGILRDQDGASRPALRPLLLP